jgi:hypothetical protein
MKRVILYSMILAAAAWFSASATIINVPGDYPTIGAGMGAASHGDTVLVQPGTYNESIFFSGYGITVASMFISTGDYSYIDSTVIDGEGLPCGGISFGSDWYYYQDAIIGFTIQNCSGDTPATIVCFHNTVPLISFNIIRGNPLRGIWTEMSHPTIIHNVITGNSAGRGGGMYLGLYTEAEIYNNIIAGNLAEGSGGGIYYATYDIVIFDNNTIFGNTAGLGGGIYCRYGSPTITNTILWGNDGDEIYVEDGSPSFRYCDIEGSWAGEGNIDLDPLFRDAENGDSHLMSTECGDPLDSPCIDAGDPSIFDSILDCNWGLGTELSDMGAYAGSHIDLPTHLDENTGRILPTTPRLFQNYPNPFNAATVIRYRLHEASFAAVSVYNLLGQRVAVLCQGIQQPGQHTIIWDASDLPSGIYFARLEVAGYHKSVKMVLLK